MPMLWVFLFGSQLPSSLPQWDVDSVRITNIYGMESPTGILNNSQGLLAVAGLEEAFAGVYSLALKGGDYHAQLLKYLPQMDVEDVSRNVVDNSLRIICGRKFSPDSTDWTGQLLVLEPSQLRLAESSPLSVSPNCFDASMGCGLVALEPLSESRWFAVKKKDASTLYILEKRKANWFQISASSLTLNRKFVTVSAVRKREDTLYFLVKDQWVLAALPLAVLETDVEGEVRLETRFDFGNLQKHLMILDKTLAFEGMAEGFDFDSQGNLLVLLNNRGHKFQGAPGLAPLPLPKILKFQQLIIRAEDLEQQ